MMSTPEIPRYIYLVETGSCNDFYINVEGALMAKEKLDAQYKSLGLSRKAPMFKVRLEYSVY